MNTSVINPQTIELVTKSLWFQGLWFVAVIGQDSLAILLAVLIALTMLFDFSVQRRPIWPWYLAAIGIAADYTLMATGVLAFSGEIFPRWLLLLWFIFCWYLFQIHPTLTALPWPLLSLIGGVSGAGSYYAGKLLGAVSFPMGDLNTLSVLLLWWALLVPVLLALITRFKNL
jgi:hypothetical protein